MKYFKNTSWLFAEKILRMVVGLFVGIWVARYLGPEQFGLFSYAQSFVFLFTAIATLGLDSIVVRELVKDESKREQLLGSAFILKLIGAFGVLILLAIAVHLTTNDHFTNVLIFIIASATVFQSFNVIDFYFQSKVLSKYVVYVNIISLLISSLIKIILIINEAALITFAYVIIFDSFILAIGLIYIYIKQHFSLKKWKFDKTTALSLLQDSWPLILAGIALSINQKIDQVMIKEFLGSESVGLYAAATRLIEAIVVLPFLISKSLFPSYVKSAQNDITLFNKKIIYGYRAFFLISLLPVAIFYFLSEEVIMLTFGSNYVLSGDVLKIYSFTILFASIGAINMLYLRTLNYQKKVMNRQITNVFINVSLNFYFIPQFGIIGAAMTTLISIIFTTVLYDLFDKNLIELNKLKYKSLRGRIND